MTELFEWMGGAEISDDGVYRYELHRVWDVALPYCMFLLLNPSTADGLNNDPTVGRCVGYAKSWGYGGMRMGNLFGFRARFPSDMFGAEDPVGPENDEWLLKMVRGAGLVVAAWGALGGHLGRDIDVMRLLEGKTKLHCLKTTKEGHPGHPLYLRKDLKPITFQPRRKR